MSRDVTLQVLIDGIETPCREIHTSHGTDMRVATGSLLLPAPHGGHVALGVPVIVNAGYDGFTRTIFNGRIPDTDAIFSEAGGWVRVELEGWSKYLWYGNDDPTIGVAGPTTLKGWWAALCHWAGIPVFLGDDTTDPDGDPIMLASNPEIGGWIPLSTTTPPGGDIDRVTRLFGYRSYDTPDGTVRLSRVSGLPTADWRDLPLYTEGENMLEARRVRTLAGTANYWEVKGAEYKTEVGAEVAIRSIPATYTPDPLFGARGVNHRTIEDAWLVTQELADACRNVNEIDYGTPEIRYTWETTGDPGRCPGEQVAVLSPTVNGPDSPGLLGEVVRSLPRALWVTHVTHDISDGGWITALEGWAGNGTAHPAGDDCVTQTLMAGLVHLGTETLSYYRNPSPNGNVSNTEHELAFTLVTGYTTATITFDGHGCNTFNRGVASTASRFELWQGGEKRMSGEMPRLDERHVNFNDDANWATDIPIPMTGTLDSGTVTLRIVSGRDSAVGDYDDFEVKNIRLRLCGVGTPVPVEEGP